MRNKIIYMLVLVVLLTVYIFLNFGRYLDVSQKPVKSDIVVCLGGGKHLKRIKMSLSLYKEGYAEKGILLVTGGTAFTQKDELQDARIKYLNSEENNLKVVYNPYVKNTAEEMQFLKEYMEEHHYRSALIVSEEPYTRRISMLFGLYETENNCRITLVSSTPSWWQGESYYTNKYARYMALSELVKIPYNYIVYGILSPLGYLPTIETFVKKFGIRKSFHVFIRTSVNEIENEGKYR